MHIAVIGAGCAGTATALALAQDGHQVSVFERAGSVAAESSFAPSGLSSLWPAPGELPALQQRLTPAALAWRWQRWRHRKPRLDAATQARWLALLRFSQEQQRSLMQRLRLTPEHTPGHLLLLANPKALAAARPRLDQLAEWGVAHRLLDAEQCLALEPGLNPEQALHAGIQIDSDDAANPRQWAQLLRQEAQQLGVVFHFNTEVVALSPGPRPQLSHLQQPVAAPAPAGPANPPPRERHAHGPAVQPRSEAFDAVVLCTGTGSPRLQASAGLKLPLTAVWGCSITAPMQQLDHHPARGPRGNLSDLQQQVHIGRLGNRLRVSGGAELGARPDAPSDTMLQRLHAVLNQWFPGVARMGQLQHWTGARATLPDGLPLLGAAGPGLWLNLAQGDQGWAMAHGMARLLADGLSGRAPVVDSSGFGLERLR